MEKGQLNDHEQDGLVILKILVGTVLDFVKQNAIVSELLDTAV